MNCPIHKTAYQSNQKNHSVKEIPALRLLICADVCQNSFCHPQALVQCLRQTGSMHMVSSLVRAQLTYHNTNFKNTLYTTPLSNNLSQSVHFFSFKSSTIAVRPHFLSTNYGGQSWLPCLVLIFIALKSCNLVAIIAVGFLASKTSHYNGLEFHNAFFLVLTKNLVT